MPKRLQYLNFYILLGSDLLVVAAAHWLAYLTRFEGLIPEFYWDKMVGMLPIIALVKITAFFSFNLYRGMWRYTSAPDLMNVVKACTTSSLALVGFLVIGERFAGFSRSVFLLDWLYSCLFVAGLRIGIRVFYGVGLVKLPMLFRKGDSSATVKAVVLGGGKSGERVVRELMERRDRDMNIAAIFDDDSLVHGRTLHGIPVIGSIDQLPHWVQSGEINVNLALIAVDEISGDEMRRVVGLCEKAGLDYRRIPSLSQLAQGKVSVKDLLDVDYKDLLGREQVDLDVAGIASILTDKTVLVTGAGGSIGSELCRQIIPFEPRVLLMLDASEFNLYSVQMELEHEKGFDRHVALLGSLQDKEWTKTVLQSHKPDVVFHAAAYKHVPLLEDNPAQAVRNNILATAHLVSAAVDQGVERLLIVSTDKAVRPTNVMGASKRMTERIMQSHCGRGSKLMAVRFGNVIGSAGSVIPLFRRQIAGGGPVTVTHPEVVRYFMTIEEACKLIIQAAGMGEGGEIFVLKMGKPVRIADMAADLIRLSGKEPGKDIEIKFIGLRPGEKLFEELITDDEGVQPTDHERIMALKGEGCLLDDLKPFLTELQAAAKAEDGEAIRSALRKAIPEYRPDKAGDKIPTPEDD